MDLLSANRTASWNPLTALVTFESAASERELYLVPITDMGEYEWYSTAIHELAHL
jgi:hypothetical protein